MGELGGGRAGRPKALEFFAGIGLARMGLEAAGFEVAWANDSSADKKAMYQAQFGAGGGHVFALGDVAAVRAAGLPRDAALAWASSPCTDLSLAGGRAGLAAARSGAFWHFVRLLRELGGDRPRVAVLENVTGLATSQGGRDLAAAIRALNKLGYSVDALAIDARRFLPQSRPRLFLVAAQEPPADGGQGRGRGGDRGEGGGGAGSQLRPGWLQAVFSDPTLRTHQAPLPAPPALRAGGLGALVEELPADDPRWWGRERVAAFSASLAPVQRARVESFRAAAAVTYRTAYRRTRGGAAVWEVRPDDIAGCLRTARGGSSKQALARMGGGRLQVRWLTPREYARLMGAPDYDLGGARVNQALFGFGDAVAVPAVAWLARHYLMPLATARGR